MSSAPAVVVQSRLLFAVLLAGCLVYAYVFAELAAALPEGSLVFVFYSVVGMLLGYITWASANVISLDQDTITVSRLFGLGPTRVLRTEGIRRVLVRPDNLGQVSRIALECGNGRIVQLHRYQRNFEVARSFLDGRLCSVPREVQSKWAL